MYVYQKNAIERIKKGIPRLARLVQKGIDAKYNEADTRKIVDEMFVVLGWDRFDNITQEQMISSCYADYVIKTDSEELFVVEVKQVNMTLRKEHLNQAKQYAIDEGIEYTVLTNGNDWEVYKIEFDGKIPNVRKLFSVRLTDGDTPNADKAQLLYLLSEEASRKKEINDYYEYHCTLSGENLATQILSDRVINELRITVWHATKESQYLKNSEIAEALLDRLFREDVITDEHRKMIQKMQRTEKR